MSLIHRHNPLLGRTALFSPCEAYRYRLEIILGSGDRTLTIVMLNPSTADENADDPTVRNVCWFARHWGFGRVIVTNVYALRSTDPAGILTHPKPTGTSNWMHVALAIKESHRTIFAWGDGKKAERTKNDAANMRSFLRTMGASPIDGGPLMCFGHTKAGNPKHPLYLPHDSELMPFEVAA